MKIKRDNMSLWFIGLTLLMLSACGFESRERPEATEPPVEPKVFALALGSYAGDEGLVKNSDTDIEAELATLQSTKTEVILAHAFLVAKPVAEMSEDAEKEAHKVNVEKAEARKEALDEKISKIESELIEFRITAMTFQIADTAINGKYWVNDLKIETDKDEIQYEKEMKNGKAELKKDDKGNPIIKKDEKGDPIKRLHIGGELNTAPGMSEIEAKFEGSSGKLSFTVKLEKRSYLFEGYVVEEMIQGEIKVFDKDNEPLKKTGEWKVIHQPVIKISK